MQEGRRSFGKSLWSVVIFLLMLVYCVGRLGVVANQTRMANQPTRSSIRMVDVPQDVIFADTYITTCECEGLGEVEVRLSFRNRPDGRVEIKSMLTDSTVVDTCRYGSGCHYQFKEDSLKFGYPIGTVPNEAVCPIDCQTYRMIPHSYFLPEYHDTLFGGNCHRMLVLPGFQIVNKP